MCKSKEAHSFCAIPPCYMCLESCKSSIKSSFLHSILLVGYLISYIYGRVSLLETCAWLDWPSTAEVVFLSYLQLFFSDDRDVPSSKMLSGCSTGVVLIYKKHITFSITAAKIQMLCKDWVSGNKLKMQIMQIKSRTRHNYFNGRELELLFYETE